MADCPCTNETVLADTRTYVPSQTERADQLHQLLCPCGVTTTPTVTDYATRDRKIRSLATGCCPRYSVVPNGTTATGVTGGAGFTTGNYLSLVGGTPVSKPLLFRVLNVNGSGAITTTQIAYSAQYYQKPTEPYSVVAQPGATGSGTFFTTVNWADVCPCPWQYTKTY